MYILFSFAWSKVSLLKQRPSSTDSVAERGLTSPVPRWGWSQGRTPMATTAVRWCFHDAEEWLVSWIRTVLSDSAGGDSATPGRRNTGRMWNVTEQGHSEGHRKTCHPSPPSLRNLQPGFVLHMENIMSEFILCLRWQSDLGFVCLCVRWWWMQTTMSWFEKGNVQAKISQATLQLKDISVAIEASDC